VHHKQHGLLYNTDPVLTLLTGDYAILPKYQIRIGEYARCRLEIDASVLLLV
jgi:hypothetical protein